MAVSTWVRPRLTDDVDIVVMARRKDAPRLKPALIAVGARVTALEMRLLFERRFVLLRIDDVRLDVHIASSAHDKSSFEHAARVDFGGRSVRVASAEDLILYKLKAWRPIDKVYIASLLEQVKAVRMAYIESWLDRVAEETGADIRDRWKEVSKAR